MHPTRSEVESALVGLIDGSRTREDAAGWAWRFVADSDPLDGEEAMWRVLEAVAGADSPSTDRRYLFGTADFEDWLAELRAIDA